MMKKLVALVMVLALSAVASAMLTVDVANLQNISILGDGTTTSQPVYIMITGDLVMDFSTAVTLPGLYGINDYSGSVLNVLPSEWVDAAPGDTELLADLLIPGNPIPNWTAGRALVTGVKYVSGSGDVLFLSEDSYYDARTTDLGSVNFVPEPITVALLGLGGLFIRRRKVA